MFALYDNLSRFLDASADNDWEINSRVISATFQQHGYSAALRNPAVITLQHREVRGKSPFG